MTNEIIIWLCAGVILIISEFLLPGLVSVFLGISALLVSLLIYLRLLNGVIESLTLWFIISVFLLLTIRQIAARLLPSESEFKYFGEDVEALGKIVEVVDDLTATDTRGRIRFQGTDWPARTDSGIIKKGAKAIIKYRDNISWVVGPVNSD